MTPEAQREKLRQTKDKVMLSMKQDWEILKLNRENTMGRREGQGVGAGTD
jgi:hypothetical protein